MSRVVVAGGMVHDGGGGAPLPADVLVEDGRIAAVGRAPEGTDATVLDATGCVVAPGFIDIHSHSDFTLLVDPRAASAIHQGVTTELVGNCGYGCAPIGDPAIAREVIYGFREEPHLAWRDMAGYLSRLEAARPAVNVAALVPNGQLRLAAVGLAQRPADAGEIGAMGRLLAEAMEQGAFGYSTGLEYATECGAGEEEVTRLAAIAGAAGGLYATHTRNRDDKAVEAVGEAVRTAEAAGVRLQVSHITPRGGRADTERAIGLVDAARRRGLDVAFDMHTRTFGTTYLKTLLPPSAFAGGTKALRERLASPAERARMRPFRNLITALGDFERVVLLDHPDFPELSRLSLAEIGRRRGTDALDAAYDILLADVEQVHRPMVILHSYTEDLLAFTYDHACCTVGSDATTLCPDGPLAGAVFHGAYTWAAWFWRRMVRERRVFSPEAAVERLARMPAERMGLFDRGRIAVGARADVIAFDPERLSETGTTFEPSRLAVGMRHVLVNGAVTLRDGNLTGTRAGAVLRPRGGSGR
jgi:N-acyl-D-aspartate/D-glutamate deacylase